MTDTQHTRPVETGKNASASAKKRHADRELAKLGLTVAMGALVVTGLTRTKSSRKLHLIAGGALIGLSVWHHMLYHPHKTDHAHGPDKDSGRA